MHIVCATLTRNEGYVQSQLSLWIYSDRKNKYRMDKQNGVETDMKRTKPERLVCSCCFWWCRWWLFIKLLVQIPLRQFWLFEMHKRMQVTENTGCMLIRGTLTYWSDVTVFAS
jgi:hypothetical protein